MDTYVTGAAMLNSCGDNVQQKRKRCRLSPPGAPALPHRNGGSQTPDTRLRKGGIFNATKNIKGLQSNEQSGIEKSRKK